MIENVNEHDRFMQLAEIIMEKDRAVLDALAASDYKPHSSDIDYERAGDFAFKFVQNFSKIDEVQNLAKAYISLRMVLDQLLKEPDEYKIRLQEAISETLFYKRLGGLTKNIILEIADDYNVKLEDLEEGAFV